MKKLVRTIRRLAERDALHPSTDQQLLDHFFNDRDEGAFAALVDRHGPMVLGVCLRMLRHSQDAEDAFQATFLTLARKGRSIRYRGALASWLYRVAYRAALRLNERTDRQNPPERLDDFAIDSDPIGITGSRELLLVLDQEIQRLPVKYRTPMILCYIEEKTYEEAAAVIGCPKGTVAIRLLRGREMLKGRLIRRGLLAGAAFVAMATAPAALGAVPLALSNSTTTAAIALTTGAALANVAPLSVAALVHSMTRDMSLERIRGFAVMVLVTLGLTGAGGSVVARSRPADLASPIVTTGTVHGRSPAAPKMPRSAGRLLTQPGTVRFSGPGWNQIARPATIGDTAEADGAPTSPEVPIPPPTRPDVKSDGDGEPPMRREQLKH